MMSLSTKPNPTTICCMLQLQLPQHLQGILLMLRMLGDLKASSIMR